MLERAHAVTPSFASKIGLMKRGSDDGGPKHLLAGCFRLF